MYLPIMYLPIGLTFIFILWATSYGLKDEE